IENPVIGIPILIIVIVVFVVRARANAALGGTEWSTAATTNWTPYAAAPPPRVVTPLRGKLEALRNTDPGFSIVVFEDFVYFLYAEMHRARGAGGAESLAAYVADHARLTLQNDGRLAEVNGIIIGGLTYESVHIDPQGGATVDILIESNYVERYRPQGEQRFYVKERLRLTRAPGARSRDPGKARTLNCPNCGGPLSNMRGTTCGFCHTTVPSGSKDWAIGSIQVLEKEPRGPLLTSNVGEEGTNLPTIFDANAQAAFAQIQAKDPQGTSWQQLQHRVGLVFQNFHAGWVARDPAKVRPYVSDNLFQSQMYWIDLYRNARCINRTDGSHITRLELANATTDAYYDAVTVRLYATGLDYTIGEDGRLMSGSQSVPRSYSEYWTMIRGAQKKKTDKGEGQCPNCGAPLKISMTGNCEYCAVKVTSGEYDWVLSRIEQDETYTG
ncbi:MAG TPA: TIM44-like domain-containing protein, partial [Labilithrix sp.]|nr:TIM44-like domain-containing protein [Labilithrix sp.]